MFLHSLLGPTSLIQTDIAKLRTNPKAWNQLLTINKRATELKDCLDTTLSEGDKNGENLARVYPVGHLEEPTELTDFLVSELRFKHKLKIRAMMEPARAVARRYYCLIYPERMGRGYRVWEGLDYPDGVPEGRIHWTDYLDKDLYPKSDGTES